jgi:siroheme synthase
MNSAAMMNIQVDPEMVDAIGKARAADYRLGHRDARHAAAVIALKMDADIERLREQNRLLAMDKIELRGRLAAMEGS